jgi:hypothetical protein
MMPGRDGIERGRKMSKTYKITFVNAKEATELNKKVKFDDATIGFVAGHPERRIRFRNEAPARPIVEIPWEGNRRGPQKPGMRVRKTNKKAAPYTRVSVGYMPIFNSEVHHWTTEELIRKTFTTPELKYHNFYNLTWTKEVWENLYGLYKQGMAYKDMVRFFNGRSANALYQKLYRMDKKGVIVMDIKRYNNVGPKRRWMSAEKRALHYLSAQGYSDAEIGDYLDRTSRAIHHEKTNRRVLVSRKNKPWVQAEVDFARRMVEKGFTLAQISQFLDRPVSGICRKVKYGL